MSDANGTSKVTIDRFWLSIGLPVIIYVFLGGVGWATISTRLAYTEEAVKELKLEMRLAQEKKDDDKAKLVIIETKLGVLEKNMDKALSQLEVLTKRAAGSRI